MMVQFITRVKVVVKRACELVIFISLVVCYLETCRLQYFVICLLNKIETLLCVINYESFHILISIIVLQLVIFFLNY